MFIATRLPLIISATSEMLSISLVAEEVRRPCTFYKHYVPTARFCPDSLERLLLRQSHPARLLSKSLPVFTRRNKRFDHLGLDVVPVELIQLGEPEVVA